MLQYLLLLVGFVLLIKGADFFVEGAASTAKILKIPSIIVGLTVVAMGTSLPEASVSITAALAGKNELSLSNVVGSNIFNLLVVAGASALLRPIAVQKSVLKKDFPFSIIITLLVLLFCIPTVFQGQKVSVLSNLEGVILLVIFVLYLVSVVRDAKKARSNASESEEEGNTHSPLMIIVYIVGGVAAIIVGGNLVVDSASAIAADFGLSQTLIGLTVVALGTSLPELVTSIVAAKRGESDLALGNVIGSNIFNMLMVLGLSCSLHPVVVIGESVFDLIFLTIASLLVFGFAWSSRKITKKESIFMLPIYFAYLVYIIIR